MRRNRRDRRNNQDPGECDGELFHAFPWARVESEATLGKDKRELNRSFKGGSTSLA